MKGWHGNSQKHSLASKGIKSKEIQYRWDSERIDIENEIDYIALELYSRVRNYTSYEDLCVEDVKDVVRAIVSDMQLSGKIRDLDSIETILKYGEDKYAFKNFRSGLIEDLTPDIYDKTNVDWNYIQDILGFIGTDDIERIGEASKDYAVKVMDLNPDLPLKINKAGRFEIEIVNEEQIPDDVKDDLIHEYKRGIKFGIDKDKAVESAVEIVLEGIEVETDKFDIEANLTTFHTMESYLYSEEGQYHGAMGKKKTIKTPTGFEVSPQKFAHITIKKFNGKDYELVKNTMILTKNDANKQANIYRDMGYKAIIKKSSKYKSISGTSGNIYHIFLRRKEE